MSDAPFFFAVDVGEDFVDRVEPQGTALGDVAGVDGHDDESIIGRAIIGTNPVDFGGLSDVELELTGPLYSLADLTADGYGGCFPSNP